MVDIAEAIAVSRQEAASLVRLDVRAISEAIHSGALPAKKVGRHYRIAVDDLRAWFAQLPDA